MNNKNTRIELIAYIKANSPKILGINRMKKEELLEVYSSITKPQKVEDEPKKEVEEQQEKEVEEQQKTEVEEKPKTNVEFDFKTLSKDSLKYDINMFLEGQNKRLSGINSKSKDMLLKVIKHLKITKHYTDDEKDIIKNQDIDESNRKEKLERTKTKIEKYITASNNIQARHEYIMSDDIEAFESLIEKYEINKYDYTNYEEQQEKIRRAKKAIEKYIKATDNIEAKQEYHISKTIEAFESIVEKYGINEYDFTYYERQQDEKFKCQFEKSLLESGLIPISVSESENDFKYNINGINVVLAKGIH